MYFIILGLAAVQKMLDARASYDQERNARMSLYQLCTRP